MDNEKPQQLNINLSPETAKGQYSNLAIISHSHSEFILDYVLVSPGMNKPEVVSRIILAPEHAKRLLAALNDNILKYEAQFGRIELDGQQQGATFNLADLNPNGTRS